MKLLLVAVLVSVAVSFGCTNKLGGELEVDGQKFELDSCRSGQVYGFSGVELRSKAGDKIRLVQTPTGEAVVVLIARDAATGTELGTCGPFTVSQQNSTINDVKNVEGSAKLECTAAGHTIKGSVSFANCH